DRHQHLSGRRRIRGRPDQHRRLRPVRSQARRQEPLLLAGGGPPGEQGAGGESGCGGGGGASVKLALVATLNWGIVSVTLFPNFIVHRQSKWATSSSRRPWPRIQTKNR